MSSRWGRCCGDAASVSVVWDDAEDRYGGVGCDASLSHSPTAVRAPGPRTRAWPSRSGMKSLRPAGSLGGVRVMAGAPFTCSSGGAGDGGAVGRVEGELVAVHDVGEAGDVRARVGGRGRQPGRGALVGLGLVGMSVDGVRLLRSVASCSRWCSVQVAAPCWYAQDSGTMWSICTAVLVVEPRVKWIVVPV